MSAGDIKGLAKSSSGPAHPCRSASASDDRCWVLPVRSRAAGRAAGLVGLNDEEKHETRIVELAALLVLLGLSAAVCVWAGRR
ncbi:hypothetical protein ACIP4S_27500 [Streptomyces chartreusis]|uniref:hypothetical protein n=1 Tax=Streptomyces chartreusis TaxID=1969 RepID=UPI0037FFA43F